MSDLKRPTFMKTRELYSIVLKIIGLISLWRFVSTFLLFLFSCAGLVTMFSTAGSLASVGYIVTSLFILVVQLALVLIISIYCIFRTNTLLKILKLDDDSTLELLSERKVLYHLLVLSFGVYLFADGLNSFYTIHIKTDTISDLSKVMYTGNNIPSITNMTESKNHSFNFLAFIEAVIGVLLLIKSRAVTNWILRRVDSNGGDAI